MRVGTGRPTREGWRDAAVAGDAPEVDLLALGVDLDKLAALDSRQDRLVELWFFDGLTVAETAVVLGVAPVTIKWDSALARTTLDRELRGRSG